MKYLKHPIAVYAAKLLVYAALSAGVFILMSKFYRSGPDAPPPADDSTRLKQLELTLHINDSTLQTIKHNVDSIQFQAQAHEAAITRIRSNRTGANSYISAMSSVELTGALANRYLDSIP